MELVNLISKEYESKCEKFILPLTGLSKSQKYKYSAYLFWNKYSINNYNIILKFEWDNYEEFVDYCKKVIFDSIKTDSSIICSFDYKDYTLFVLDMSKWAKDIDMFINGRYSQISETGKSKILDFHTYIKNGRKTRKVDVPASLYPNKSKSFLNNLTPIEYLSENYEIDVREIGEIVSIYNKEKETLYE